MSLSSSPGFKRHSYYALCCEEPFRVFFPLGLLAGIVGLFLWPLFLWGVWKTYPVVIHSRLMVEGFMAAFIFGFLGTAGPRILGAANFTRPELGALLLLYAASMGHHLAGSIVAGDAMFLALLLSFVAILGIRFARREEIPPPNFVLVGFGMLSAIVGTALIILSGFAPSFVRLHLFGSLLLHQGFVLLPVIGVGVFLFPRFLGTPPSPDMAELRKPTRLWKRKALIAAATAFVIFGSFAVESFGYVREAGALRFLAATFYTATQMPAVLRFGRCPFLGHCVRGSTWLLLVGLLWPVILPAYRVAGLHLVFIGGFMLVTFAVATRVMLGHSGQAHLFKKPLPFLISAGVLLLIGMGARIGADFMPSTAGRNAHLLYGALLCISAALIWGIRLVPRVTIPDTED